MRLGFWNSVPDVPQRYAMEDPGQLVEQRVQHGFGIPKLQRPEGLHRRRKLLKNSFSDIATETRRPERKCIGAAVSSCLWWSLLCRFRIPVHQVYGNHP